MNNEVCELNEAELDGVAGGMSCSTAIVIAKFYRSVSTIFYTMGDMGEASYYAGKSGGVVSGGCG